MLLIKTVSLLGLITLLSSIGYLHGKVVKLEQNKVLIYQCDLEG